MTLTNLSSNTNYFYYKKVSYILISKARLCALEVQYDYLKISLFRYNKSLELILRIF